jgi:hypothetical protein
MDNLYSEIQPSQINSQIHWGHFGAIMMVTVLVLGMSWMEKPELFSFKKSISANDQNAPHYYAYVPPASGQQPEVLGASTNPGPSVINDDGTVSPVDMGNVLAATTQDVQLSLDNIKVNQVPDSDAAIMKYFLDSKKIEINPVDTAAFQSALTSNNQSQINQQAGQLIGVRDALQKLAVPQGLVTLQKLKIIQYTSAINLLQNFLQADSNPTLVDQNLMEFIKSQQDLDNENTSISQKYASLYPSPSLSVDSNGQQVGQQSALAGAASSDGLQNSLDNLGGSNATQ